MPAKEFVAFTRLDASDVNAYLANKSISNAIINGAFDIWQRGTTFSTPASGTYTADRTIFVNNGSGSAYTISRENNPNGSLIGTNEPEFFYRYNQTTAGTGATLTFPYAQRIENVRIFSGNTVTVSAYIKTNSPRTASFQISFNGGSGASGIPSALTSPNFTTSTSWERYTFTTTIPNFSGATIGSGNFMSVIIRSDDNVIQTFDIWGVQLEPGTVANDFRRNANSLQGELAACQRYYYRIGGKQTFQLYGNGYGKSATAADIIIPFPVQLRTQPTVSSNVTSLQLQEGNITVTSITSDTNVVSSQTGAITANAASGITANRPYSLRANNSLVPFIDFSSEL